LQNLLLTTSSSNKNDDNELGDIFTGNEKNNNGRQFTKAKGKERLNYY